MPWHGLRGQLEAKPVEAIRDEARGHQNSAPTSSKPLRMIRSNSTRSAPSGSTSGALTGPTCSPRILAVVLTRETA